MEQDSDYFERKKISSTEEAVEKIAEMARMRKAFRVVATKINFKRWDEANEKFKTTHPDLWAELTPSQ